MTEQALADPRWGQEDRDKKALAILHTLARATHRPIEQGVWLDVGCGSGGIAATLAQSVTRIIGVDPEPWQRWSTFQEKFDNLEFHVGTYKNLDAVIAPGSIDCAVCNQVYEHVDDPAALLVALYRAIRPGGLCYFAGPNLLWPIEPHVFWPFVHWLPRATAQTWMRRLGSKSAHLLDAYSSSYWGLTKLFRDSGFLYRTAIGSRVQAGAALSKGVAGRMLGKVPAAVFDALTPLNPSFVFVLEKPGETPAAVTTNPATS